MAGPPRLLSSRQRIAVYTPRRDLDDDSPRSQRLSAQGILTCAKDQFALRENRARRAIGVHATVTTVIAHAAQDVVGGRMRPGHIGRGPGRVSQTTSRGTDPAHTGKVRRKQERRTAEKPGECRVGAANGSRQIGLDFSMDIQPGIQALPLSRIMEATGLSFRYCSLIQRGSNVPHRRHWASLRQLAANSETMTECGGHLEPLY
jgi:hypothetical protein